MSSITSRIAAIRAIAPRPAPAGGSATAFSAALAGAQAEPGADPAAAAGGYAAAGFGVPPGASPVLQGATLNGSGQIAPALPGAAAVAGAYGVAPPAPATAGTGVLGPARSGPPPELQAHGNGRIPDAALAPIGDGDHQLWAPAARAFGDLRAAAAADGVTLGVNSSYRSVAEQQVMVDRYGLYSQGGRAAAPGTSNHGWGVSIDLQLDDRAQAWMRANGARFGFVEDVPREPWHWTFTASSY